MDPSEYMPPHPSTWGRGTDPISDTLFPVWYTSQCTKSRNPVIITEGTVLFSNIIMLTSGTSNLRNTKKSSA
jgi:hypothetical protein